MYKHLNKIIDISSRAIYDVSKLIIIIIDINILCGNYNININEFSIIFNVAILMYILNYIIFQGIYKCKIKGKIKNVIYFILIALSTCIPMSFLQKGLTTVYGSVVCLGFLVLATKSIMYIEEGIDLKEEITKVKIFLMLILLSTPIILFVNRDSDCAKAILKSLIIYFVSMFFNLARINLIESYNSVNAIVINRDKNMVRMNIISVFIIISTCLVNATKGVRNIGSYIANILEEVIYKVCTGIVFQLSKIIPTIKLENKMSKPKNLKEQEELAKEAKEQMEQMVNMSKEYKVSKTGGIIMAIIFAIIIIIVICFIAKKISKKQEIKNSNLQEEKTFVFKFKNIKDNFLNAGKFFSNGLERFKLHPIRKLYIQLAIGFDKKGIKYNSFDTPLEYQNKIETSEFKEKQTDKIIELYNKVRYGKKYITKEEIDIAYKIKNDL